MSTEQQLDSCLISLLTILAHCTSQLPQPHGGNWYHSIETNDKDFHSYSAISSECNSILKWDDLSPLYSSHNSNIDSRIQINFTFLYKLYQIPLVSFLLFALLGCRSGIPALREEAIRVLVQIWLFLFPNISIKLKSL